MKDGFEVPTPGRNRGTVRLPFLGKHAEHCRSLRNIDIMILNCLASQSKHIYTHLVLTRLDVEVPYAIRKTGQWLLNMSMTLGHWGSLRVSCLILTILNGNIRYTWKEKELRCYPIAFLCNWDTLRWCHTGRQIGPVQVVHPFRLLGTNVIQQPLHDIATIIQTPHALPP